MVHYRLLYGLISEMNELIRVPMAVYRQGIVPMLNDRLYQQVMSSAFSLTENVGYY
jgi:hypothetical protein